MHYFASTRQRIDVTSCGVERSVKSREVGLFFANLTSSVHRQSKETDDGLSPRRVRSLVLLLPVFYVNWAALSMFSSGYKIWDVSKA